MSVVIERNKTHVLSQGESQVFRFLPLDFLLEHAVLEVCRAEISLPMCTIISS